jgi:DNA-directed RNA polymerase subunit beta'
VGEAIYNRINDYASVKIRLASPEDIRSWSYGEVRKPETINYRTYRPEKDGLFCERIFGPEKDYECACGKYKGIKHKGTICDKCGVLVAHSRIRRKRMGHINLAAPVAHIWFFKAMPSRMGNLLAMKTSSLERVIYFQDYVVIDPGDVKDLKPQQLLTDEEYRRLRTQHGNAFKAEMGAEAVRELLRNLDLEQVARELREGLKTTRSKQKQKDFIKRLKTVEMLRDSNNRPEWMVLEVIPVIPPDLRPLVLLDSGNFATSDLNDLYRRLINRNNRLKKLLDLNAPDVIIKNEKRMLQQSVDALFDNGRCRRPVLGSSNRPLKSLTDMIKGKQGRFRENLLGKRVDYSARSVIVVGPELRLHQCGLPKTIALELFQPFIIRRLKELGLADTIKAAKKMLERRAEEVWDILEEVIKGHPVLLNRAPTLHRMGIQAFEPVLIEGNAIKIHPLVCTGFNADFDGDQMAVHLPLSYEAQIEASTLMLSSNNIFSPASGNPIIAPSQDVVLGAYYLTVSRSEAKGAGRVFSGLEELFLAYAHGKIGTQAPVRVRMKPGRKIRTGPSPDDVVVVNEHGKVSVVDPHDGSTSQQLLETTAGRIIFNDMLPKGMPFYNYLLPKRPLNAIISDCYQLLGQEATLTLLDDLKNLGFKASTRAGVSIGKDDMLVPSAKEGIIAETEAHVAAVERDYREGNTTDGERYNKVVDLWTNARQQIGENLMKELREHQRNGKPYLNPIFCMADSGARGSVEQIRQLAGMRGLMAKPNGKIIEAPIKANFREGLRVLEYFSSTHGARKGLADTALKTADSGYLTRKLADVAQNVVVTIQDCGTMGGIAKSAVVQGDKVVVSLAQAIRGRVARDTITDVITDEVLVEENQIITEEVARKLEAMDYPKIRVRSPLTCEAGHGVCARCYGMDLARGQIVEVGLAIGIIAAQSIGEPGTQLTMRTFHIGGVASTVSQDSTLKAPRPCVIEFENVQTAVNRKSETVVLSKNGILVFQDKKGREIDRKSIPLGSILHVERGEQVRKGHKCLSWDPNFMPILAEAEGKVQYEDIDEGKTMRLEVDPKSKITRRVIMEHKGEKHPQIVIVDEAGTRLSFASLPEKAYIEIEDGKEVQKGDLLAKTTREMGGVQDITGGLPRVTELFEARKPKEPAIMAEIDGRVEFGDKRRGKLTINLVSDEMGISQEHLVPHGKHLRVHGGDVVRAGDPLTEGPLVPHDILRIRGEETVQSYLLQEIQSVYRSQSVPIDDKHIEIIVSQMMRKVQVNDPGETEFLPGAVADKFKFRSVNKAVREQGGKPASASPLLLGITKASLQSESFISAASFQETTKVLTEAALAGKVDTLVGLKENVILGHMVPTGTGFKEHFRTRVKKTLDLGMAEAFLRDEPAPTRAADRLSLSDPERA